MFLHGLLCKDFRPKCHLYPDWNWKAAGKNVPLNFRLFLKVLKNSWILPCGFRFTWKTLFCSFFRWVAFRFGEITYAKNGTFPSGMLLSNAKQKKPFVLHIGIGSNNWRSLIPSSLNLLFQNTTRSMLKLHYKKGPEKFIDDASGRIFRYRWNFINRRWNFDANLNDLFQHQQHRYYARLLQCFGLKKKGEINKEKKKKKEPTSSRTRLTVKDWLPPRSAVSLVLSTQAVAQWFFFYGYYTFIGSNNYRLMWRFVDFIVPQNKRFLLFRVRQKHAARKSAVFCIRYFSKTKSNPAKKNYRTMSFR